MFHLINQILTEKSFDNTITITMYLYNVHVSVDRVMDEVIILTIVGCTYCIDFKQIRWLKGKKLIIGPDGSCSTCIWIKKLWDALQGRRVFTSGYIRLYLAIYRVFHNRWIKVTLYCSGLISLKKLWGINFFHWQRNILIYIFQTEQNWI